MTLTTPAVSTEEFMRVMLTNALGVMRAVEGLQDLVRQDGLIGVMSSGAGERQQQHPRGARGLPGQQGRPEPIHAELRRPPRRRARAIVLIAPGWVRTELGGPEAPLGIEDSIPKVVDVLIAQRGRPGLRYLDRDGNTVPW